MEALAIIKHIGMTFAIGAATFAIIFYYQAMEDGVVDKSERHFMHTVYFLLRIGMGILIVWELGLMLYAYGVGGELKAYTESAVNWFRVILLGIILININLMTKRLISVWAGSALVGGSLYYYYFVSITNKSFEIGSLLFYYILFILFFIITLRVLQRLYIKKKNS